jgi:hypothetical protein
MVTTKSNPYAAILLPDGMAFLANPESPELYDPESGTFTSTSPLITVRFSYQALLLADGRVLISGGSDGYHSIASTEVYDPKPDSTRGPIVADGAVSSPSATLANVFVEAGEMTSPRYTHTATLLANGKVLIASGGDGSSGLSNSSAELYDPSSGVFSATGMMGVKRYSPTATLLSNGKVLLSGGDSDPVTTAELYDPASGIFTATGSMTSGRDSYSATLLLDGRVLIAGGIKAFSNPQYSLSNAEVYNPSGGTFVPAGNLSAARYSHTATLLQDGRVLLTGGESGSGEFASADLYDPGTRASTATGKMLAARSEHSATLLQNGQVLVAGGANGTADRNYASAELFDPSRRTFSATGSMAAPRYGHAAVLLPSGKVLVVGGATDSGVVVSSAEIYDPASGTFTRTDSMTVPRYGHTATLLADGKTLIAGGRDSFASTAYLRCAELYE